MRWSSTKVGKKLGDAPLVVVRSQEIDAFGESGHELAARQVMDSLIGNISRAVRKLTKLSIEQFLITSDHGHHFSLRKVETQRQWSDLAIARTTPVLMALFSLVCLMVHRWREHWPTLARSSAWYLKSEATFSDCIALVRRRIWGETYFDTSAGEEDPVTISPQRLERLLDQLAATA